MGWGWCGAVILFLFGVTVGQLWSQATLEACDRGRTLRVFKALFVCEAELAALKETRSCTSQVRPHLP
jgi:hypothetical protein